MISKGAAAEEEVAGGTFRPGEPEAGAEGVTSGAARGAEVDSAAVVGIAAGGATLAAAEEAILGVEGEGRGAGGEAVGGDRAKGRCRSPRAYRKWLRKPSR